MLQNLFLLFFVACLGVFFWRGYRRVFSQTPYRHMLWSFLAEECEPERRRTILRCLLAGLPGDNAFPAWLLTLAAISLGGAGALFWYLIFSLLWLHPLEALAGLWHYYQPEEDGPVRADRLLAGMMTRKKAQPRPGLERLLRWLQTLTLCMLLPLLLSLFSVSAAPSPASGALPWLIGLVLVWLLCRCLGERGEIGLALLFLLTLAVALVDNLSNLIPAIKLVVRDAFDQNRFIFALSGGGLAAVLQSGGAAGCCCAVLRTLSPRRGRPVFSHPAQAAFYDGLRGLIQMAIQLILGLLFLCTQLVPQDNRWSQRCLWLFLCLFSLIWGARVIKTLLWPGERRRGLLCFAIVAAVVALDFWIGNDLLALLTGGAAGAMALALAGLLMLDSNWYFLLLEHYRDARIWHTTPHPDLLHTEHNL